MSLLFGLVTLILSALLTGCGNNYRASIEEVTKQSRQVLADSTQDRESKLPDGPKSIHDIETLAAILRQRASRLRQIDTAGCPPDFVTAFVHYIRCIEDTADLLQQHPPARSRILLSGTSAVDEMTEPGPDGTLLGWDQVQKWSKELDAAKQNAKEAQRATEDVGIGYGLKITP